MFSPTLRYSAEVKRLKFYTVPKSRRLRETIARLKAQLDVNQVFIYSDENLKEKFDPEKHPRGQPDNAGQFVEKAKQTAKAKPEQPTSDVTGGTLGGKKPPPIPDELYSKDTVIQEKPKPAPIISVTLSVPQDENPPTIGRALETVNPNFNLDDSDDYSYRKNCQNCTVAYELQRRGYKVTANPHSGKKKDGEIGNAFEVFDLDMETDYQRANDKVDLEKELTGDKYPDGARFVISQKWAYNEDDDPGHDYVAEKTKNGIRYLNPQEGGVYTSEVLDKAKIIDGKTQLFFARIDDKDMKEDKSIDYTKVVKAVDKKDK